MTIEIDAHPVESKEESDSCSFNYTFRLQVLDVATGLPLRFAIATEPTVDKKMQELLDKRGSHPFLCKEKETVNFKHTDLGEFSEVFPCLRTFKSLPQPDEIVLQETYTRVPEVFEAKPDSDYLVGAEGELFVEIRWLYDDQISRYVKVVKDPKKPYAQRGLATNSKGILEIPIKPWDWINCTSIKVKLRDYKLLMADGEFAPERLAEAEQKASRTASDNGHKALTVRLAGKPDAFRWCAKASNTWRDFVDVITLSPPDQRLLVDPRPTPMSPPASASATATVWAVRRTLQAKYDEILCDKFNQSTEVVHNKDRKGICIHYNSGYNLKEKRQKENGDEDWIDCIFAVNDNENHFPLDLNVEFDTVKKEQPSQNLGYNYHIGRDGVIVLAGENDERRMNHAGSAKEMTHVEAILPGGKGTMEDDISNPVTQINKYYFGVVLVGDHQLIGKKGVKIADRNNPVFHFNIRQIWYLDRLIENLRVRCPKITWKSIQGHVEVRLAFDPNIPENSPDYRHDPGLALTGGMEELRGRHVEDVPRLPGPLLPEES